MSLFVFILPELNSTTYLLLLGLPQVSPQNTEAPFFCHKRSLSKSCLWYFPRVKHSLIPFSKLSSANKSYNPCSLPFCKTRQLAVSGSLFDSSKASLSFPLKSFILFLCVHPTEPGSKRRAECGPPTSAHGPFHPLTHTQALICWVNSSTPTPNPPTHAWLLLIYSADLFDVLSDSDRPWH